MARKPTRYQVVVFGSCPELETGYGLGAYSNKKTAISEGHEILSGVSWAVWDNWITDPSADATVYEHHYLDD